MTRLTHVAAAALMAFPFFAPAQFVPPSDGSDGALIGGCCGDTTIDLSQAITGSWDDPVPPEDAGKGIYDPEIWAVVFKYTEVRLSRRSIYYNPHPSGAPVVWLVQGDVYLEGWGPSVSVSASGQTPGSGGFAGGPGSNSSESEGPGLGPGGGGFDGPDTYSGGSHATAGGGADPGPIYGNVSGFPLIGGSGGSGRSNGQSGGGGGGALAIFSGGTVEVVNSLVADGGSGSQAGGGAGGTIRIVANAFTGRGSISAQGGQGANDTARGGDGRIFIQTDSNSYTGTYAPEPAIATLADGVEIFPDALTPAVRSVRLAGEDISADPDPGLPEVTFAEPGAYQLLIETENVPANGTVTVRVTPRRGDDLLVPASFTSGDLALAQWTANLDLPAGSSSIQVLAELP